MLSDKQFKSSRESQLFEKDRRLKCYNCGKRGHLQVCLLYTSNFMCNGKILFQSAYFWAKYFFMISVYPVGKQIFLNINLNAQLFCLYHLLF